MSWRTRSQRSSLSLSAEFSSRWQKTTTTTMKMSTQNGCRAWHGVRRRTKQQQRGGAALWRQLESHTRPSLGRSLALSLQPEPICKFHLCTSFFTDCDWSTIKANDESRKLKSDLFNQLSRREILPPQRLVILRVSFSLKHSHTLLHTILPVPECELNATTVVVVVATFMS